MHRLVAGSLVYFVLQVGFIHNAIGFQQNSSGGCSVGPFSSAVECGGSIILNNPLSSSPAPTVFSGKPSRALAPVRSLILPILSVDGTGPCVGFQTVTQAAPPTAQQLSSINGLTTGLVGIYGLCPNAAIPAAVAVNPAVVAASFWETIPLPAPKPMVPPGYAITGKPAYLVTDGQVAPPAFHQQTVVGPLNISAKGVYEVDWGDGSVTGPYTAEGLPYPNGNIAHTYDDVGSYTVTVIETWTATWSLGVAAGTLEQLHTQGVIDAFPVRQIQAVITG